MKKLGGTVGDLECQISSLSDKVSGNEETHRGAELELLTAHEEKDNLLKEMSKLEKKAQSAEQLEKETRELKEELESMETKAFEEMERINRVHDKVRQMLLTFI